LRGSRISIYDIIEEEDRLWLVMELVLSRSLDDLIAVEGRLPAERVGRIGQQLLSALAAVHATGLLHCYLKPSNRAHFKHQDRRRPGGTRGADRGHGYLRESAKAGQPTRWRCPFGQTPRMQS